MMRLRDNMASVLGFAMGSLLTFLSIGKIPHELQPTAIACALCMSLVATFALAPASGSRTYMIAAGIVVPVALAIVTWINPLKLGIGPASLTLLGGATVGSAIGMVVFEHMAGITRSEPVADEG